MDKLLNKYEVQAQLAGKSEEISRRLDALQEEVATVGDSLQDAIFKHPLASVGGAILAGVCVGLIVGGSGDKESGALGQAHRGLIDGYVEAVAEEARRRAASGLGTEDAVRAALQDRVPVIVYNRSDAAEEQGFFGHALDLLVKTALGFAVKAGIDFLTSRLQLDELAHVIEARGGADSGAPVAAAVSEL